MERLAPLPAAPPELTPRPPGRAGRAGARRPAAVRRHRRGPCGRRLRRPTARSSSPGRTSAGTTRSTRWWAGCCSTAGCPAHDLALAVTSRASFEIVQKAWSAGFPARGGRERADRARRRRRPRAGMTLAGFARAGRLNLYARSAWLLTVAGDGAKCGRTRQLWRARGAAPRPSGQAGWRWRVGWVAGTGIAASSAATQPGRPAITWLTPGALPSTRSMPGARSTTCSDRSMWATSPAGARPEPR